MAQQTPILGPAQRLDIQELVRRLELHLGRGGIFCLAADHGRTRRTVEHQLVSGLGNVLWHTIEASHHTDVLLHIWNLVQRQELEPSRTVFSVHATQLRHAAWKRFLTALNIRREYIPEGHLTLVLWVTPRQLDDIPRYAKDFWSFRTAVHRFRSTPSPRRRRQGKANDLKTRMQEVQQLIARLRQEAKPRPPVLASLYFELGTLAHECSELTTAQEAYIQAVSLYRELDDTHNLAAALGNLGLIYHDLGDLEQARKYLEEALGIDREIGYLQGVANQLGNLGLIYRALGDLEQARKYLEERDALLKKRSKS